MQAESGTPERLVPSSTPEHESVLAGRRDALIRDVERIFVAGGGPVCTWEVGCGHGHFLNAYAKAHPNEICIGVDIASDRIERAMRKRDRARLANLHFLRTDARLFLEVLPPALRFSRIFVLFPDPWPKSRHHKHRVMQADFLAWVARRTARGGRLYFRTDHTEYFRDTQAVFAAHPAWRVVEEAWPFEYETVFQSRADAYQSLVAGLAGP